MEAFVLLFVIGLLAGALNAAAGGGLFITFPAFVYAGVPPIAANASSTVALFPGSLASASKFKEFIRPFPEVPMQGMITLTLLGGGTIEKIKNIIIDLVHHQDKDIKVILSDVLSSQLNHDYNYLSNLFSTIEGITIEKYFIAQKIEKVKELLVYDELSLSEIAFRLNYSSVAYLSNQFKKVTGLTPSHFKQIREDKRKPLDEV